MGRPQQDWGRGRKMLIFGVPVPFLLTAVSSEFSGTPILRPTAGTSSQIIKTNATVHRSYSLKSADVP